MGKTQSENSQICNLCDFIEHFFFSCLAVRPLWNFIESCLHVKLVLTDVFFGYQNGNRNYDVLKGLAHAKIIKKSVILFRVLNMTI